MTGGSARGDVPAVASAAGRVVRVVVDVPALADQGRELDYLLPPRLGDVSVGTIVRVPVVGRRVGGWVVAVDVDPPPGIRLQPVARVSGHGPSPDLVDLTAWAAWRWAGRRTALLRAASPPGVIASLPARPADDGRPVELVDTESADLAREALTAGEAVVRLPPATNPFSFLARILAVGPAVVVSPSVEGAQLLLRRLVRESVPATAVPEGWARAAAGGVTVVGARAAAWAPAPDAAAIVVLDAHDDGLVETRAPAWSAWVVAAERARRAGIPCILVSACPLLEQLQWGRLITISRAGERQGWGAIEVVDRSRDDPRAGVLGERLVPVLRGATIDRRVVCVLNRKGRVRLLACRACRQLTLCEHCGAAVSLDEETLTCRRCRRSRAAVCQACGSGALRAVRAGVSKLREDVEALARLPVGVVTAEIAELPDTPVVVGTEAVLHRLRGRDVGAVIFVEFDAELLAPRYRAGEEALALLALASRVVGGRNGGRVLVQTRQPDHVVIQAAVRADPGRLVEAELGLRRELRLPPAAALAELSGDEDVTASVAADLRLRPGVEVVGPTEGRWLVRAPNHRLLCDALAVVGRPAGADGTALRIDVDPPRV